MTMPIAATVTHRNRRVALTMAALVAAMVGLAFASVPLYRMFCQATGFNGTTKRAAIAPGGVVGESVRVRFDANVDPKLPWRFEAPDRVTIEPGAKTQVLFRSTNLTARPITGQAVFNVTPAQAGQYFSKIECFCFTEQTLKGGESVDMPVVFFVDPKMRSDPDTRNIDEITLSYTFYPVESAIAAR